MSGRPSRIWVLLALVAAAPSWAAAQQPSSRMSGGGELDTDEDGQPAKLPALPAGMTLSMIRQGDSLFRGKGGCTTCHGQEATGMPNMGSSLTGGLHFIPPTWGAIDTLITEGLPRALARRAPHARAAGRHDAMSLGWCRCGRCESPERRRPS